MVGHSPLPAFRHEQWCFNKLLPHCDGLRKKSLKCNHCRKYRQHCRGDQWSPVFYCFVGNHRSGCRNNRTGRRVSSSPKRSPCRLSPGAPATRQCRSRAHAACTRPRWSCRRGEHTAFMSAIGCSELFIANAPDAHNRRGGDLLGDRSCKSRADTRLRQSVNVHQNKRAPCPAESSECRKQVFIYMVHLADRREYRVGGFLYVRSLPPCRRISPLRRL